MPTFDEVLSWDGTSLRTAGEALFDASRTYEEVYHALSELDAEGLEGETAEAEAKARRILADDAEDIQTALASCGNDLSDAGDTVDTIRQAAEEIKTRAAGDGFSIVDGYPVPTTDDAGSDFLQAEYRRAIVILLEQADDVLLYIEGVYDDLADLSSSAKGPSAKVVDHGVHTPPTSWTPQEVNDWWTALSEEERSRIIKKHPDWVGNLDGIPAADRHKANLVRLDGMIAQVAQEIKDYEAYNYIQELPTYMALLQRQADLEAIQKQFESLGKNDKHTLLLVEDTGERIRAAVGSGDIDNADHVVVYTPGMTSTVESTIVQTTEDGDTRWRLGVNSTDRILEETRWQLDNQGRTDESVAGITWLGYDAPGLEDILTQNSVLGSHAAKEAAPDLASVYDGVQATHHGDPHLVAAAHSYGSTVTGEALWQTDAPDDVITWGSAGTRALDASDVDMLPLDHMYSATTSNDFINWDVVHEGGNPDRAPDYTHLETDASPNPDYDGTDANGAKKLQGSSGHNQYTSRGDDTPRRTPSTSLYNIGSVVADSGDSVITENSAKENYKGR